MSRDKFLQKSALTIQKDHKHTSDVWSDLSGFLWMGAEWHLLLMALLLGLLVIRAIPFLLSIVYCHDSLEKDLAMSDFNNFWHTRKNMVEIYCMFKSSLTSASTFHITGLFIQQSPKCYLICLSGQFRKLSPHFHLCDLRRDDLNTHCLQPEKSQPKFPHICIKNTTQTFVFSPVHCHWQLFQTSHAFLLQISWV